MRACARLVIDPGIELRRCLPFNGLRKKVPTYIATTYLLPTTYEMATFFSTSFFQLAIIITLLIFLRAPVLGLLS